MNSDRKVVQRIVGPAELVQAIPYLLGFHPQTSLVLVGLADGLLVVTARLDLPDVEVSDAAVRETMAALARGGSTSVLAAVYDNEPRTGDADPRLARLQLADLVEDAAIEAGCVPLDVLLVSGRRWWSLTCSSADCCQSEGYPVPDEPSAFAAAATYAGVAVLPDRGALERLLEPQPCSVRAELDLQLAEWEEAAASAALTGRGERYGRSAKRALFAAARSSAAPGWDGIADDDVARFGAALAGIGVRDSVWMAIDDGRLDGRALWCELARRLPSRTTRRRCSCSAGHHGGPGTARLPVSRPNARWVAIQATAPPTCCWRRSPAGSIRAGYPRLRLPRSA